MKIKNKLLLGTSVLALSMGSFSAVSNAQAVCRGPAGNIVPDHHCGHPLAGPAPVSCSGGGGDGGGGDGGSSWSGGGDGGDGGYSDTNGDHQGDTPSRDGGPHGSTDYGGDGGGGGKVLCGYYYAQGLLPYHIYQGDLAFDRSSVDEATRRGYHFWAVPLVNYLYNNPGGFVEKIAQPFVIGWATEMAYRVGYNETGHWLGKVEMSLLVPIAYCLGKLIERLLPTSEPFEKMVKRQKALRLIAMN